MVNARFVTTLQPIADQSPRKRRSVAAWSLVNHRQVAKPNRSSHSGNRAATEIILLLFLLYHFFSYWTPWFYLLNALILLTESLKFTSLRGRPVPARSLPLGCCWNSCGTRWCCCCGGSDSNTSCRRGGRRSESPGSLQPNTRNTPSKVCCV